MQTEDEELTFNDLPVAVALVLDKVEKLEIAVSNLREDIYKSRKPVVDQHQPIEFEEACSFLKMSKSTLYHYVQHSLIPTTKKGKKYIFFRDELVRWLESGRQEEVPTEGKALSAILSHQKRKHSK